MAIVVNKMRCCSCLGFEEPLCVQACPGDLMALSPADRKAFIREPQNCWDCMACVKACPTEAIDLQIPFSLANRGASLKPHVSPEQITWMLTDLTGQTEEFVIPTKTIKPSTGPA